MSDGSHKPHEHAPFLRKVWDILATEERRQLLMLLPLVVLTALFETAGVASIVPFLALLSDPDAIAKSQFLSWAYAEGGFVSNERFFFFVGLGVLAVMTIGNTVSALTTWRLLSFSWMGNHTLSMRLLGDYLRRPYAFFLRQNTADLSKNILSEVQGVVTGVLVQGVQVFARGIALLFVIATLFVLDPAMALGAALAFGGVYGGIFLLVRRTLARMGRSRVTANQQRFKLAAEALGGIKELKLYGLESAVLKRYAGPSMEFATLQARHSVIAQIPKFVLETIAFGGLLGIVLYLLALGRTLTDAMPVLGLYAFAAYRMLPALQTIFAGITTMRFQLGALNVLHGDLEHDAAVATAGGHNPKGAVRFEHALTLRDVSFSYDGVTRPALDSVTLTVGRGDWLALVGTTGAGKSTLVDVMLGLLAPTGGSLLLDGEPMDEERRRAWQGVVGYVPQQIFLADDTVAKNISFGAPGHELDVERMRWAARVAQIDEFVLRDLPAGYDTSIGERGVRLSGGQRQRIGIARALYRKPKLLVLDEATSALDGETEKRFFAGLQTELRNTSVVSIAHRLTTTQSFDKIHVIEHGRIVDTGSYKDLLERHSLFRQLDPSSADLMPGAL